MSKLAGSSDVDNNENLPPEMWAMIFKWVGRIAGTKTLLNLRQICKDWRDNIDNHLFFQPTVNDVQLEISRLSHLRVRKCVVKRLMSPLCHQSNIFRDPSLVKTLVIDGPVSQPNFMNMVAQFTNLEHLTHQNINLDAHDALKPSTPGEETNLNRFLARLTKLELKFDLATSLLKPCQSFLLRVVRTEMTSLDYFRLHFGCFSLEDSDLLPFLLDHAPNLKHLRIESWNWRSLQNYPRKVDPLQTTNEEIRPLHLHKLELQIPKSLWKENWMPIIELQRSLEKLQIEIADEDSVIGSRSNDYPMFNDLAETLVRNAKTLNSLQLENIALSEPLNVRLLQQMEKLSSLSIITRPNSDGQMFKFSMQPPSRKIQRQSYRLFNRIQIRGAGINLTLRI